MSYRPGSTVLRCVYPECPWEYEQPPVTVDGLWWDGDASGSPGDVIARAVAHTAARLGSLADQVIRVHLDTSHPDWSMDQLRDLVHEARP